MVVLLGASGTAPRIVGGLVATGGVLAMVGSFLPIYTYGTAQWGSETTVGAWVTTVGPGGRAGVVPTVVPGIWLALVTAVALAAAAVLVTAARRASSDAPSSRAPSSRAQSFGAFGAGLLAAAATAQCVEPIPHMLFGFSGVDYRVGTGWVLLLLAAACGLCGGIVAATARSVPAEGNRGSA